MVKLKNIFRLLIWNKKVKVDIIFSKHSTLITFFKKDITSIEDIRAIAASFCAYYCFESNYLYSNNFDHFIKQTQEKIKYGILIGNEPREGVIVHWGKLTKLRSNYLEC